MSAEETLRRKALGQWWSRVVFDAGNIDELREDVRVEMEDHAATKKQLRAVRAERDRLREAVRVARDSMQKQYSDLLDGADQDDDNGTHIGFARHARAVARGVGDALTVLDESLRARGL